MSNERKMIAEDRRRVIADLAQEHGSIRASELTEMFNVTETTIRRDLADLAGHGVLERAHGGAVARRVDEPGVRYESVFSARVFEGSGEKHAIGACAAERVADGSTILSRLRDDRGLPGAGASRQTGSRRGHQRDYHCDGAGRHSGHHDRDDRRVAWCGERPAGLPAISPSSPCVSCAWTRHSSPPTVCRSRWSHRAELRGSWRKAGDDRRGVRGRSDRGPFKVWARCSCKTCSAERD